jgi:hypothetical protein
MCAVCALQVLKLEYALEQQDEGRKQLQQQLAAAQEQAAALQQQLAEAQHEAEAARMQAAAGSAGGSGPLTHSVSNFSMAAESEESWITGASVEVLLPKIVALWEELYVPLVYRWAGQRPVPAECCLSSMRPALVPCSLHTPCGPATWHRHMHMTSAGHQL